MAAFSARPVPDDAIVRCAGLARVWKGAHLPVTPGADRGVLTRAEGLFFSAATTATATAARTVPQDAVPFPFGQAGIGEGLAVAVAPGADRLVLHGAELWTRPGRARARPIVDDDSAGRQQRGQDEDDKALPRDRKKSHVSLLHPGATVPARDILAFPPGNATTVCGAATLDRRPHSGPCLARLWPMTSNEAGSNRGQRWTRRGPPATVVLQPSRFRVINFSVRAFATRRAERFGRPFPDKCESLTAPFFGGGFDHARMHDRRSNHRDLPKGARQRANHKD